MAQIPASNGTVTITARVDRATAELLRQIAREQGATISTVVARLARQYVTLDPQEEVHAPHS